MKNIPKRSVAEFNKGLSEDFVIEISSGSLRGKKISVSLYKDLGNYHVEFINEADVSMNKTYSAGMLSQARSIFKDKANVAIAFNKRIEEQNGV